LELHVPCSCRASTVLLCASGASHTQAHWPTLALTLHLHFASMRICRNCTRTVHLGSAVALHCAARTAGACSFVIILTVSRPVAIKFLMVLTVGVVTSPRISLVSCASSCTRQGFLGLIPERKTVCTSPQVEFICPYQPLLMDATNGDTISQKQATPGFFTGRSLMVANDGHHTRRRTFHAVSFSAFAVG